MKLGLGIGYEMAREGEHRRLKIPQRIWDRGARKLGSESNSLANRVRGAGPPLARIPW